MRRGVLCQDVLRRDGNVGRGAPPFVRSDKLPPSHPSEAPTKPPAPSG